jgi:hypothetical protein
MLISRSVTLKISAIFSLVAALAIGSGGAFAEGFGHGDLLYGNDAPAAIDDLPAPPKIASRTAPTDTFRKPFHANNFRFVVDSPAEPNAPGSKP